MIERLIRMFLYYPTRIAPQKPIPPYVRGAREVWLDARDNNRIHGLYWPAPKTRPVILFLHGNAQSVFEWALVQTELAPMDCGLLLIDYPGYGKSTGSPSEDGLYNAADAALQWLVEEEQVREECIVVFGKSLGGGVASHLARRRPLRGVVLESTFRSIPSVARRLLPMLPADAVFKQERYDTASRLADITAPVLVVHGTRDELIPYDEGQALYEQAREPKELYCVEGAGHNDVSLVAGAAYGKRLRAWLDGTRSTAPEKSA